MKFNNTKKIIEIKLNIIYETIFLFRYNFIVLRILDGINNDKI